MFIGSGMQVGLEPLLKYVQIPWVSASGVQGSSCLSLNIHLSDSLSLNDLSSRGHPRHTYSHFLTLVKRFMEREDSSWC